MSDARSKRGPTSASYDANDSFDFQRLSEFWAGSDHGNTMFLLLYRRHAVKKKNNILPFARSFRESFVVLYDFAIGIFRGTVDIHFHAFFQGQRLAVFAQEVTTAQTCSSLPF